MRRRSQWIGALLMFSLTFAQLATAAHACSILSPANSALLQADTAAGAMPTGCAEMAKQSGSTANVCESHCVIGQQADPPTAVTTADSPPQSALTIRLPSPGVPAGAIHSSLLAWAAASSPLLLFSRFLI